MDTKALCLAVLVRGDATGYEIRKAFERGVLGHIQDASFSAIYPALKRLKQQGLVTRTGVAQVGRPAKRIYSITPVGRMALVDALMAEPERDRLRSDFLFQMLFAQLLPAHRLETIIEERLEYLRQHIDNIERHMSEPGATSDRFVHGFGLALSRAAEAYIEEHKLPLLRESLLAERGAAE